MIHHTKTEHIGRPRINMDKFWRTMVILLGIGMFTACKEEPTSPSTSKNTMTVVRVMQDGRRGDWPYTVLSRPPHKSEKFRVVLAQGDSSVDLHHVVSEIDDEIRLRYQTPEDVISDSLRIYVNDTLFHSTYLRVWLKDIHDAFGYQTYAFMQSFRHSSLVGARRDIDEIGIVRSSGKFEFLPYEPAEDRIYHLPFMSEDFRFFYYDVNERLYRGYRWLFGVRKPGIGKVRPDKDLYGVDVTVSNYNNSEPDVTRLVISSPTETYTASSGSAVFTYDLVTPGHYSATLEHPEGKVELGEFEVADVDPKVTVEVSPLQYRFIRIFNDQAKTVDTVFKERPYPMETSHINSIDEQRIEFGSTTRPNVITMKGTTLDLTMQWAGHLWGGSGRDSLWLSVRDVPYTVDSLNRVTALISGRDIVKSGEVVNQGTTRGFETIPEQTWYDATYEAITCVNPEDRVLWIRIQRPR